MNKKDEIKIEVLSNIDDNIIEKQSIKRFKLMNNGNKQRNKKLTAIIAIAATFAILFSVMMIVIVPLLSRKQVPIYEGMTVENINSQDDLYYGNGVKLLSASSENTIKPLGTKKQEKTLAPEIKNHFNVEGSDRSLYYAKPNEDIYINIHINNPDQYEILSFTLNGIKYQSFMFEDGSTSEKLIFKVNVGNIPGVVEYTIDAIKYVDGDKIKDVRMDGDKTVKVGVYSENQPVSTTSNQSIGYFDISFDLNISDELDLIGGSNGEVFALICDENEIVSEKKVKLGESNSFSFDGLIPGKAYKKMIIAYYDSLDGNGFDAHVLEEENFYTKGFLEITDIIIGPQKISFNVNINSNNVTITKIDLLLENDVIAKTIGADCRVFEDLLPGKYRIRLTYTCFNNSGEEKVGFAETVDEIVLSSLSGVDMIVSGGIIIKEYSDEMQIYNPSTQDYRNHYGIDISSDSNNLNVHAAFSGFIKEVYSDKTNGNVVVLSSFDGSFIMKYMCLGEITVTEGETVSEVMVIGTLGTSAKLEDRDPPHVHIELFVNGEMVDPSQYIK